jgi:hypothetical protein
LQAFFSAFPTPSAALDASPAEMEALVKPLGLFYESRYPVRITRPRILRLYPLVTKGPKAEHTRCYMRSRHTMLLQHTRPQWERAALAVQSPTRSLLSSGHRR